MSSSPMSLRQRKKQVTPKDVVYVQNLIERCLQMYMPRGEVVQTLQSQAKVDPAFTSLVWQKLEEQNPDFFRAYYLRLKLKDQVVMFNYLVEQQLYMMQKLQNSWMQAADDNGMHHGSQAPSSSLGMPASMMAPLPKASTPYPHPLGHNPAGTLLPPNNNSSTSVAPPQQASQQGMGMLPQSFVGTQGHQQHHHNLHALVHEQPHHQHNQHHHDHSDSLITNTPMLQSFRCLDGSADALDALGGVEDLTLGMNSFPSANDLIDLAGGQMDDGHLNLGMGDLGDCELEHL